MSMLRLDLFRWVVSRCLLSTVFLAMVSPATATALGGHKEKHLEIAFTAKVVSVDSPYTVGKKGVLEIGIDPRFLLKVKVRSIQKGKEYLPAARLIAIHSVARTFGSDVDGIVGKRFKFSIQGIAIDGVPQFYTILASPMKSRNR